MSKYTEFVKAHIRSAPGAHIKDKMRAVAAMWRKQKGRGLAAPGMSAGRGTARVSSLHDTARDWSDYGDRPALNGEGVKRRYRKKGGSGKGPMSIFKKSERPEYGINGRKGCKLPPPGDAKDEIKKAMLEKMLEKSKAARGGKVAAMRMKRGGCYGEGLSGLVSKKQAAALAKHIRAGGKITPGSVAKMLSCMG